MIEGMPASNFNGGGDRHSQPGRRHFSQENRDAETHGHRNQQRQEGGDQGAVNRYQGAEVVVDRIPLGAGNETETEGLEGQAAAPQCRGGDACQQQQDQHGGPEHRAFEPQVVTLIASGAAVTRHIARVSGHGQRMDSFVHIRCAHPLAQAGAWQGVMGGRISGRSRTSSNLRSGSRGNQATRRSPMPQPAVDLSPTTI